MLDRASNSYKVIKLGLNQLTSEALQRIISWRGKMVLSGTVYRDDEGG